MGCEDDGQVSTGFSNTPSLPFPSDWSLQTACKTCSGFGICRIAIPTILISISNTTVVPIIPILITIIACLPIITFCYPGIQPPLEPMPPAGERPKGLPKHRQRGLAAWLQGVRLPYAVLITSKIRLCRGVEIEGSVSGSSCGPYLHHKGASCQGPTPLRRNLVEHLGAAVSSQLAFSVLFHALEAFCGVGFKGVALLGFLCSGSHGHSLWTHNSCRN